MNPTPTLPRVNCDFAFMENRTTKKFFDSYKWLMEQYNNKSIRLDEYEKRPDANKKYVLQEKAFLIALARHLENIEPGQQYINYLERMGNHYSKQCILMEKICSLFGISKFEIIQFMNNEPRLDEMLAESKTQGKVLAPIALKKIILKA